LSEVVIYNIFNSMARSQEKAMAMLNRWVRMKRGLNQKNREKRPDNPFELGTIQECEAWRTHLLRDLVKKVADIQNALLGEYRIRELNDEINELMAEKKKWEDRIRELGGPDYRGMLPPMVEKDGVVLPGSEGYYYWGAAKNLPKVRELFQKEVPPAPQVNREELYKRVTYRYLGLENTKRLEKLEQKAEKEMREKANTENQEKFLEKKRRRLETAIGVEASKKEVHDIDFETFKKMHEVKPRVTVLDPSEQDFKEVG